MTSTGGFDDLGENPSEEKDAEMHGQQSDKRPTAFNIDALALNADWPKRHWDLPTTLDEWRRGKYVSSR
ncbi:hypothetical protein GALL_386660 [mine drainage metagenome]|uniref:Uncharacterized protein n=1 Tax=mine drainage metagenome TaxID=410659 RepID=A0A1J5Q7G7_9ZZZZ